MTPAAQFLCLFFTNTMVKNCLFTKNMSKPSLYSIQWEDFTPEFNSIQFILFI